ncbi:hypothetical protein ACFTZF_01140 [Streptomyces mirabilis]
MLSDEKRLRLCELAEGGMSVRQIAAEAAEVTAQLLRSLPGAGGR